MRLISFRTGILSVAMAIGLGFHTPPAEDILKNAPELTLPLTDKKWVMAHCMTNIIRYKGHKMEDSCNPDYYPPTNNISAPLGGLTQVKVVADSFLANASLDEAVEFEMRAAMQSGIDGFQFYYTLGNDSWDEIIKAYFRVADKKQLDFTFTFCISHPSGNDENKRIADFAKRINSILDEVGRSNPHWFRTPDGRLIIYTWYGDGLADIPANNDKPAAYYVANAYKKLEKAVNEKFACAISINEQISDKKLDEYLDYFPAVWLWTLPYTDTFVGGKVAARCKKRKRVFMGSAFPDFYTSKLLKKGSWDMFHYAADAVKAGIAEVERKYIVTGLSYNFRKQLEFSISNDVPVINIITWNDYPEGHHLAPEINHNDGFSLLLQHYKAVWKKEISPLQNDVLIAFYKKYKHDISPSPYNIPVVDIEKPGIAIAVEDSVEVVSILTGKASLQYNGQSKEVVAGLQVTRFAAKAGPVSISLTRDGKQAERLDCPEWITDQPYRTDRLTYSFSNRSQETIEVLVGPSAARLYSTEYNAGANGNHIRLYQNN